MLGWIGGGTWWDGQIQLPIATTERRDECDHRVMRHLTGPLIAGTALITACSSPGQADSTAPSTMTPATSTNTATSLPESKQIDLTCTGSNATLVREVSTAQIGRDVYVAWSGSGEARISTSFVVSTTVTDPATGVSRILAWKSLADGRAPVQYIYDTATAKNKYVTAGKQDEPARYPDALDGMSPAWTATASAELDGRTIAECRQGAGGASSTPPSAPAVGQATASGQADSLEVACADRAAGGATIVFPLPLDAQGRPRPDDLWPRKLACDAGAAVPRINDTTRIRAPLQQKVVDANGPYGVSDPERVLYSAYQACAANSPTDAYAQTGFEATAAQALEITGYLLLCPRHPQAHKWRAAIDAGRTADRELKSGTRVYDGSYVVPKQMKRGAYVASNVKDCYWETRDGDGEIIANDFVTATPQARTTIGPRAVVFTAKGCGLWSRERD